MLQVNGTTIGYVAGKTQSGSNVVNKPNNPKRLLDPYITSRNPRKLSLEVSCTDVQAAATALQSLISANTTLTFYDPDYSLFNTYHTVVGVCGPVSPTEDCGGVGNLTLDITVVSWS